MPQGKFNHLAHFLDDGPKAPNVLVGNPWDRSGSFFHLLSNSHLRLVCDDDSFRGRASARDHKVDLTTHHAYRHIVSPRQDPALEDLTEIFFSSHNPEGFSWCQSDTLGDLCLNLPNRDFVVY